jgi:hypothetical protein
MYIHCLNNNLHDLEHRGVLVNSITSYIGGPTFESRPVKQLL